MTSRQRDGAGPGGRRAGPGGSQAGPGGRVELLADLDRQDAWLLLVDGVPQSHVDLGDPRYLELEYMRRLGHLVDLSGPAAATLRVLHLGGGGLTLARYVAATRPGSVQLAIEADPELADLVRRRLPLEQPGRPDGGRIHVRIADARAALADLPAGWFDVAVADAFAGGRTPAHLTSAEFVVTAARVLAPSGIFAVNVGDGPPLEHSRGRVAAIRAGFSRVCVIAEAAVLGGRRFGNLVVAAANRELPVAALSRLAAADPFPARVIEGADLDAFVRGAAPITDRRAEPSPMLPPEVVV